jgi:hypothetical protein
LTNALRNLGRSLLSVVAMALAALMMTASLTVAQGYTPQRAEAYRNFLGGDILVYPAWTWPAEADLESLRPGDLTLSAFSASFGSPLRYFHPNYYTDGYLTTSPQGAPRYSMFESRAEFEATIAVIAAKPNVTAVVPYVGLPVIRATLGGRAVFSEDWVVRACPPALLAGPNGEFPPVWADVSRAGGSGTEHGATLKTGRWLTGVEDGLVMIVNYRVPGMGGDYALDQKIRLTLPRLLPAGAGRPARFADPREAVEVELTVVGVYDLPSRVLTWKDKMGVDQSEQLYWRAPELLVPPKTMEHLLSVLGVGPEDIPPAGALLVSLQNQSQAEATAGEIRRSVSGLSVVSVARETTYANQRRLPEPILRCPLDALPKPPPVGQPVIPAETSGLFGLILFGFAGLLAAGSGTLLVLKRRAEFAILKAIGLRNYEVGLVVVVEAVTLAAVGCLAGFGVGLVGSLPSLLANGVDLGLALAWLGRTFGLVVTTTLGFAVVFSLAPLIRTLRITVMEVVRTDE